MTALNLWPGDVDGLGVEWRPTGLDEANELLAARHYLGPIRQARAVFAGYRGTDLVAAQVWKAPTARNLPSDGSWLELARWCLTVEAGPDAGSRMHARSVRHLRSELPDATTLVSYSDPSHGHGGALYRACNWLWAPTWHRLRPPPSGLGSWDGGATRQEVKDRWVYPMRRDRRTQWSALAIDDLAAVRRYIAGDEWSEVTHRWRAVAHLPGLLEAAP